MSAYNNIEGTPALLKEYIKRVFLLELRLYELNNIWNNIRNQIAQNNNWQAPDHIGYERYSEEEDKETLMVMGFMGYMGGMFVGIVLMAIFDISIWEILFAGFLGACLGVVVQLVQNAQRDGEMNKRNLEVRKANDAADQNAARYRKHLRQQNVMLSGEADRIANLYSETKNVLDKYYNTGVIYPKYRNLVAVSSFFDYLDSGMCTCLKGHEGAYLIYENQLMQKLILNKLDEIERKLDRIEANQHGLYHALRRGEERINRVSEGISAMAGNLQRIESNTEISAYYNRIAADNTNLLLWKAL